MGMIKLEYVIRYSSQDEYFKTENMLQSPGYRPWLCSPKDKSGHLEAEFQLESASTIDFIDIGNFGSSKIEIQVGKSAIQKKTKYQPFVPAVTLISFADLQAGSALNSVYMLNKNNINQDLAVKKWDRIKVICSQPYKKHMQFGLSFLCLRTTKEPMKLVIKDNTTFESSNERFSKCLPKVTSDSTPNDSSTREDKLLNASKSRIFLLSEKGKFVNAEVMSPKPASDPMEVDFPESPASVESEKLSPGYTTYMETFRQDVQNFLLVCKQEENLRNESKFYLTHFESQCQRSLTPEEEDNFFDCYYHLINNRDSFLWQEENLLRPEGLPFFNNTFENFGGYEEVVVDVKVERMDLENMTKAKQSEIAISSPKNKKIIRPLDFIQHDGVEPSTSSGKTARGKDGTSPECPLCGTYIPLEMIEIHAMKCRNRNRFRKDAFPEKKSSSVRKCKADLDVPHNVPCPLCMFSFSEKELETHVANCPIKSKYKYN